MPDAQARLRRLLEANRQAVEHLDLSTTLRQITEAAVEMVGSRFGAIGVLGHGSTPDEFIYVGMDAKAAARTGFPTHRAETESFLGVPLEVRDEIYGHLYLADPRPDAFNVDDQHLVEALAATAGVAIAHARLFEESTRREQWTAATSRITHELLTNDDVDALQLIAETMLQLAGADLVAVILTERDHPPYDNLVVDRVAGSPRDSMTTIRLTTDKLVSQCLESRRPHMVDDLGDEGGAHSHPQAAPGPAMAVPLPAEMGARGCLFVQRDQGSHSFTEFELDVAASLAGQAALALDYADARAARARSVILEDRDRIARDLHDHVVQRLFAVGLHIQSAASSVPPAIATSLSEQVEEIDATIRQIRSTIFALHVDPARSTGVRARILNVVKAATVTLPGPPEVTFRGPVDLLVSEALCDDLAAVVREALTNVGRHAGAHRVELLLTANSHDVVVEVLDDGDGLAEGIVLSGLENLRARAELLGGAFEIASRTGSSSGVRLRWAVPLDSAEGH